MKTSANKELPIHVSEIYRPLGMWTWASSTLKNPSKPQHLGLVSSAWFDCTFFFLGSGFMVETLTIKIGKRDLVWEINSPARMQGFSFQIWTVTLQTFYTNMPFEIPKKTHIKTPFQLHHHVSSGANSKTQSGQSFFLGRYLRKKPTNGIHVWHIQPHVDEKNKSFLGCVMGCPCGNSSAQSFGESMCFICGPYGTIWGSVW